MSANFTQAEYEEMLQRARANAEMRDVVATHVDPARPSINSRRVEPRTPKRQWNKTEEAFSHILDARLRVGEIKDWWFEGLTFKIARDCRYTPDFDVIHADGSVHLYETKGGHVRDDAQVKFRAAAALFPYFGWWWCVYKKGKWSIEQEPQSLRPGVPVG